MADVNVPGVNIPMGAGVPQAQAPDPLAMFSRLGELRQQNNANQLFQQSLAAKQRAGQIMSAAPDPESGLAALARDPQVAGFAPEIAQTAAATREIMLRSQGVELRNNSDAFGGVMRAILGSSQNPDQLDKLLGAQLATVPEGIRNKPGFQSAVNALRTSLTDGLPSDPTARTNAFRSRVTGVAIASGANGDTINQVAGTPGLLDTPNGTIPTLRRPGELNPQQGTMVQKGIGPSLTTGKGPNGEDVTIAQPGYTPAELGRGGGAGSTTGGVASPSTGAGASPVSQPPPGTPPAPPAPKAVPGTTGLSPGATAAQIKQADLDNQVATSITTAGQNLPRNMKDLDLAIKSLESFKAGGGAQTRAALGQFVQAMRNIGVPIDKSVENEIANGSLAGTQLYKKVMDGVAIRQLGENARGQGHTFAPEVAGALKNFSADTDPDALVQLLGSVKQGYQQDFDRSLKFPMYREMVKVQKAGHDVPGLQPGSEISDFPSWYNNTYNPDNLPASNAAGGFNFAHPDPAKIQGTTANDAAQAAARKAKAVDAIAQARRELGDKASNEAYVNRAREIMNGR